MATKNKKVIGYEGIGPNRGKFVAADDALDYVLQQGGLAFVNDDAPEAEAFKVELVERFFSGNWVEKEADDGEE